MQRPVLDKNQQHAMVKRPTTKNGQILQVYGVESLLLDGLGCER